MQLFDLPLDVFKVMVSSIVRELGLLESMKLRLICRLFATEILEAVITTRVIEQITRGKKMRVLIQPRVIGSYLHHRLSTDGPNSHPWISRIRETIQTLTQKTIAKQDVARIELYERSACDCLALNRMRKVYGIMNGDSSLSCNLMNGDFHDERHVEDSGNADECLTVAAWIGDLDLVRLLHQGSDKLSLFGRPSWAAAAQGHEEVLLYLLDHGALPYEPYDHDGDRHDVWMSALSTAAYMGRNNIVKMYLQLPHYRLQADAGQLFRPILAAVYGDQVQTLRALLNRHKASASAQDFDRHINWMLMNACRYGKAESGRVLLEYGADFNETDVSAKTCLQQAAMCGNTQLVKFLLDAGAVDGPNNEVRRPAMGVSKQGRNQKPALWYARKRGFTEIVKLLEGKQLGQAVDWHRSTSDHKVYVPQSITQCFRCFSSEYPFQEPAIIPDYRWN